MKVILFKINEWSILLLKITVLLFLLILLKPSKYQTFFCLSLSAVSIIIMAIMTIITIIAIILKGFTVINFVIDFAIGVVY